VVFNKKMSQTQSIKKEQQNLTQEELAEKSGHFCTTYSALEKGKNQMLHTSALGNALQIERNRLLVKSLNGKSYIIEAQQQLTKWF